MLEYFRELWCSRKCSRTEYFTVHLISTYRMTNCQARNDSIATKIAQYLNKYYSFNFRTIPKAEVGYFGQETEKTATLGKDRYTVTYSTPRVFPRPLSCLHSVPPNSFPIPPLPVVHLASHTAGETSRRRLRRPHPPTSQLCVTCQWLSPLRPDFHRSDLTFRDCRHVSRPHPFAP